MADNMDNASTPNGRLYVIKAEGSSRSKIGIWSGTMVSLRDEYEDIYGDDMTVFTYESEKCSTIKRLFTFVFQWAHVDNSLYPTRYIELYKRFFDSLKEYSNAKLEKVDKVAAIQPRTTHFGTPRRKHWGTFSTCCIS